jgi:prepilin-type N-terminal cleavage/methylation domain-containing protein
MRGLLYRSRKENGFSLIEVIVAISIITVIVVVFLTAIATTGKAMLGLEQRTIAESIAQNILETVKQMPYASTDGSNIYIDGPATTVFLINHPEYSIWSVTDWSGVEKTVVEGVVGINWDINNGSPVVSDNQLQRIEIIIKHGTKEIFTLENYKVDR